MKRILMAIMAVAVAVTFSAPFFASDAKAGSVLVYADEKKDEKKKGDKKDSKVLVYADDKKDEKKKDDKKKEEKGK
jgi:uncharacterized protein YxeA